MANINGQSFCSVLPKEDQSQVRCACRTPNQGCEVKFWPRKDIDMVRQISC